MRRFDLLALLVAALPVSCANFMDVSSLPQNDRTVIEARVEQERRRQAGRSMILAAGETKEARLAQIVNGLSKLPEEVYFSEFDRRIQPYREGILACKSDSQRLAFLSDNIEDIASESGHLIDLISMYTGFEVNRDDYMPLPLRGSILFGARRHYKKLFNNIRKWNLTLELVCELLGRDLDPKNNASKYIDDIRHRNRSDALAEIFVAGMMQKIMQSHHFGVGAGFLYRELSRGFPNDVNNFDAGFTGSYMQFALLALSSSDDFLDLWKRLRVYDDDQFYGFIDGLLASCPVDDQRIATTDIEFRLKAKLGELYGPMGSYVVQKLHEDGFVGELSVLEDAYDNPGREFGGRTFRSVTYEGGGFHFKGLGPFGQNVLLIRGLLYVSPWSSQILEKYLRAAIGF